MRVFDFQLKGLTRDELSRRRNQSRRAQPEIASKRPQLVSATRFWNSLSRGSRLFIWTAVAFGSLYALNWAYTTAADYPGTVVNRLASAKNVIILPDESGSMRNKQSQLAGLINYLQKSGVNAENQHRTDGGGFASQGPPDNSLKILETALQTTPGADAIFVFSDFNPATGNFPVADDPDAHDEAGFQRLRQLLGERRRRLYLGTVAHMPPAELIEIARRSGGGIIQVAP